MAKLLIKPTGFPAHEIELKPGVNRLGRADNNDFQITDNSVSSNHCEMTLTEEGQILVRDLGSTNGTFVNRKLISKDYLKSGQMLHLGDVEVIYATERTVMPTAAPIKVALRVAKVEPRSSEAESSSAPMNTLRVAAVAPGRISPPNAPPMRQFASTYEYKTFFQRLPSAFSYPFKSNGLILLICGTILFVVLDFVGNFSLWLAIFGFGYLFLYMQKIVQYSAQGEEDMPGWPEIANWWDDILLPALLLATSFVVSFGPVIAMWIFLDVDPGMKLTLGIALTLLGCCYLPMALLAVAMYDNFMALNPLLIIPSIIKIPLEYLVACFMLGVVLGVRVLSLLVLEMIPIPLFPTVVSGFISLYFLAVEMRILGVMYHSKREELGWNF